jgi:hypothetical protein
MTKRAVMSTCRDPENRSKKDCVCGGHSQNAKKPKYKDHRDKRWLRRKSARCGTLPSVDEEVFRGLMASLIGEACSAFEESLCGTPCMSKIEAHFEGCFLYRKEEKHGQER